MSNTLKKEYIITAIEVLNTKS